MRQRKKGGGKRQATWDALRAQEWPSLQAMADHLKCDPSAIYPYIYALIKNGYITKREDGRLLLERATGPRAPSYNSTEKKLHDWNLNPQMAGPQLGRIVRETGLSHAEWLSKNGFSHGNATRLRQMINGQRPVSDEVAKAALASK